MKGRLYINSVTTGLCVLNGAINTVNITIDYDDGQTINTNIKIKQDSGIINHHQIYEFATKYFKGELRYR